MPDDTNKYPQRDGQLSPEQVRHFSNDPTLTDKEAQQIAWECREFAELLFEAWLKLKEEGREIVIPDDVEFLDDDLGSSVRKG